MKFSFDDTALDQVVTEIGYADYFIKIAVFQIHNDKVINALNAALSKGVKVEIITLPYDSINQDIREEVTKKLKELEKNGASLYFCKWGVGDPSRTSTAVGRWYSFHGKFIVTDKSAVAISANLTNRKELDAVLIYDENDKIKEFQDKFEQLKALFINSNKNDGKIKELIENSKYPEWERLFEAPKDIQEKDIRQHWITDYPISILKTDNKITDGIYLMPFDFLARRLYEQVILNAREFVYISTESFTDADIVKTLIKARLNGIEVSVLTGGLSQDFQPRLRELYPEAASNGVQIKVPDADLHAKLIITDKVLVVGSVNLNKINLGSNKSKNLWRSNTETATICTNSVMINKAKADYEEIFSHSKNILDFLAEKEESRAKSIFVVFDETIRVKKNVREMFAKLIINNKVKSKKELYIIAQYAYIIAHQFVHKNIIEINDLAAAIVLNYLNESMGKFDQLSRKVHEIDTEINVDEVLDFLSRNNLIIKDDDFYKINLVRLMGDING